MKLKVDRHRFIMNELKIEKSVKVSTLSKKMNVVEMTIRRDLKELESEGLLVRIHGGAKLKDDELYNEKSHEEKQTINVSNKMQIAKKCGDLIHNEDIIFIGSGSTNELIYHFIKDKNLSIFTNSIDIFLQYRDLSNIDILLVGGRFRAKTGTFIGHFANKMMEDFHVSKAFIGVNGIYGHKLTTANEEEGKGIHIILENAMQKYITADSSKFGVQALYDFYHIDDVNAVITDNEISKEIKDKYESKII
ncbi:DeoR/GlpR family DNA-binding transcription regulator [Mammaliicoccus sp. Dog046]|uniref:DeoR/GlpR family DNA-binding transcription regulator n=1 Tax=Mammaliicoccus sp. Dog046 TaxID=3034233 RepID=UPI002B256FE0|nr:DeoR/GlpR family DNA-binding transcription regulator [Mammaliicoccus sp. Dog046]WQK84407.1 DeoR/GlpR family DNA-binding transcription regulator [Mammaliicoccus sp. Dog046]